MIHDDDYRFIASLVQQRCGIDLGISGQYLVEARLGALARELKLPSFEVLIAELKLGPPNSRLSSQVVDAMTTNESHFFRDGLPFEVFRKTILPYLRDCRIQRKSIRIWSAACSTGQEPYSIAMLLVEQRHLFPGWKIEIIGSDISEKVLERASRGLYSSFEIKRGLPTEYLGRYFVETPEGFLVKDEIKRMISFERVNLMDIGQSLGTFDVIFCRNVLIYFRMDLKKQILESLAGMLPSDGYLFLGGAESTTGITDAFETMKADGGVVFRKTRTQAKSA